jgi:hypothetical protein
VDLTYPLLRFIDIYLCEEAFWVDDAGLVDFGGRVRSRSGGRTFRSVEGFVCDFYSRKIPPMSMGDAFPLLERLGSAGLDGFRRASLIAEWEAVVPFYGRFVSQS